MLISEFPMISMTSDGIESFFETVPSPWKKSTLCFPVPVGAAPKPQMPEAAEALRGQNLVPWIPEKDVLTEILQQNIEKKRN